MTVFVYDPALGHDDPQRESVTIVDREGFNAVQIQVSKFLPQDITMTSEEVVCYDADLAKSATTSCSKLVRSTLVRSLAATSPR